MAHRILIIGNGGAGESTLAQRVVELLDLPVVHLDRYFWQPDWVETPQAEWERRVRDLISARNWIMDGNYGATMQERLEAADAVVFLDMPTHLCLLRVLKRRVRYRRRSRPDIAEGCHERLSFEFLRYVMSYRRTRRPTIMRRLNAIEDTRTIVLNRRKDVDRLIIDLSRATQASRRSARPAPTIARHS